MSWYPGTKSRRYFTVLIFDLQGNFPNGATTRGVPATMHSPRSLLPLPLAGAVFVFTFLAAVDPCDSFQPAITVGLRTCADSATRLSPKQNAPRNGADSRLALTMSDALNRRKALQQMSGAILVPAIAYPGAAHAQLFGGKPPSLDSRLTAATVEQVPADLSSQEDI
eukprot:477836-Rhodomonas_salina.1